MLSNITKEQVGPVQAEEQESLGEKQATKVKLTPLHVILCVHVSIFRKTQRKRVWRICKSASEEIFKEGNIV